MILQKKIDKKIRFKILKNIVWELTNLLAQLTISIPFFHPVTSLGYQKQSQSKKVSHI